MRKNMVIYKLTVEDINNVANDVIERNLTQEEMKRVICCVGNFIPWDEAIVNSFLSVGIKFDEDIEEKNDLT